MMYLFEFMLGDLLLFLPVFIVVIVRSGKPQTPQRIMWGKGKAE